MKLTHYYWYFTAALPGHLCDDIVKYGLQHKKHPALVGGTGRNVETHPLTLKETKNLNKIRNSSITWLDDPWIYKELKPYLDKANQLAEWNFEYDHHEFIQFTHYQLNQHYDWHCDSNEKPYADHNDKNFNGKIRKLSMTVSLSDRQDYEGGELQFNFLNHTKSKPRICTEIGAKGSIVVFPSFVFHRVRPVITGTRYSLVCWNLGKPFK